MVPQQVIEEWAARCIEFAKQILAKDGFVQPVLLYLAPSPTDPEKVANMIVPLHDFMNDEDDKSAISRILPNILREHKAFASLLIMEFWVKRFDASSSREEIQKAYREAGGVENMEGRFEVISTLFETRTKHENCMWRIERDADGTPRAGELVSSSGKNGEPIEGRFASMLHALPTGEPN